MIREHIPGLEELAFEGRNKAYGAYDLRKRYFRHLAISAMIGVLILLLAVFIPWFYFYFEPIPLVEGDAMVEVEYYDMSAPPDAELNRLKELSSPAPEQPQVPVVKDTVIKKEEKPVEEPPEQKKEVSITSEDSLSRPGGSGLGKGEGEEQGANGSVDVYPRFPGGDEARLYYLQQHIRYPEGALKNMVQGVVMVVFIVEVDGSVSNVNITQKIGGGCDEEAIRVTREMPRWSPGKRNGRAVRVMVRMPVVFRMHAHAS